MGDVAALTMRDLQKASAASIGALTHAVPIKSGERTVALLLPVHLPSEAELAEMTRRLEALDAGWTDEDRQKIAVLLGEDTGS